MARKGRKRSKTKSARYQRKYRRWRKHHRLEMHHQRRVERKDRRRARLRKKRYHWFKAGRGVRCVRKRGR